METKDILKQLRIDAGLTQKQISENSGVSYSAYQKYESGERELGANSLKKLADYYHKTTDYLLGREEKQEPYYHTELEDSIKNAYLSLPREVRADILQAMVDAVLNYQQEFTQEQDAQKKVMPAIQQEESEVHIRHNVTMQQNITKTAMRNGGAPTVRELTEEQKREILTRPLADEDM